MASTHSPTRSVSEFPSAACGSGRGDSTLISAMSVSGSEPTRSARRLRPSIRRTMMRSASAMTWWFVRMWPAASMRNPVPAPRRGVSRSPWGCCRSNMSGLSGSSGVRRRGLVLPRTVASMFTTAGFNRSATSANDASAGIAAGGVPTRALGGRASGAEWAGAGVSVPATISPIRNATVATRPMVTARNRRVIHPLYGGVRWFAIADQLEEALLVQHRNPQVPGLVRLAAGVGPYDNGGCLLTDRPGDLGPEAFQPGLGLVPRHRGKRPGYDVGASGQGSHRRDCGPLGFRDFHPDARLAQPVDQFAVPRLVQPAADRLGQDGPDLVGVLQLLDGGGIQGVHRAKRLGQHLGATLTDMADSQPVDDPPQLVGAAAIDLGDHLLRVLLAEPPLNLASIGAHGRTGQPRQLPGRERIHPGVITDQLLLDELAD